MYLLTTEMGHLAFSLVAGYFCFKRYKRLSSYVVALLSGFFVDLDHLLDYFIHRGFYFNLSDFLSGQHYHETNTSFIFFHSWELVLLLGVFAYFSKKKHIWCPLILGLTLHLLWDYLTNPAHWYTYFIIARYLQGFALDKLFAF
ncbi:hypothetical protein A2380_01085 [candidate division WWE3 bacterium RIFOXYB1_FULL_43_24]|nr:MAG: hypothetical protein A2212_01795 [candidate division WWE3 bacterium RIFOXYA1_FULL_42_9]OGC69838.1 MAG: hypothetical protein A2380_01085 [candidate division WWE3 bacterium RIFOXYB1_FULL_43_24]OGC72534.1 MAG: hypothetical protein A2414_02890 [candidate division WWE3 bacterium RIFOXYC1_FULL_42_13]